MSIREERRGEEQSREERRGQSRTWSRTQNRTIESTADPEENQLAERAQQRMRAAWERLYLQPPKEPTKNNICQG